MKICGVKTPTPGSYGIPDRHQQKCQFTLILWHCDTPLGLSMQAGIFVFVNSWQMRHVKILYVVFLFFLLFVKCMLFFF